MHSEAVHKAIPPAAERRNTFVVRLRGGCVAAACWSLLALGWSLSPQGRGLGTHEQLGLPPCSLLVQTGYPCPSCGLTTAFAAASQGNIPAAFKAQPFGILLLAAVVLIAAAATAELLTARPVLPSLRIGWWWLVVAVAGMMAGWGIKLAIGLASGKLPIR